MRRKPLPTQEYLRECFRYEDGKLYWLERPRSHFKDLRAYNTWNTRFKNKEAGCLKKKVFNKDNSGVEYRWIIKLHSKRYQRSVIVWILHNDVEKYVETIDHRNNNTLDDHIENLRVATLSQNQGNCKKRIDNTSGLKGVSWYPNYNKWMASIQHEKKQKNLGYFNSKEEAYAAYMKAANDLFGEFANGG